MKYLLVIIALILFSSCAVFNSLLGLDECAHPDCERQCVENCNYCIYHCNNNYNVPEDMEKKADESINKQLDFYKTNSNTAK